MLSIPDGAGAGRKLGRTEFQLYYNLGAELDDDDEEEEEQDQQENNYEERDSRSPGTGHRQEQPGSWNAPSAPRNGSGTFVPSDLSPGGSVPTHLLHRSVPSDPWNSGSVLSDLWQGGSVPPDLVASAQGLKVVREAPRMPKMDRNLAQVINSTYIYFIWKPSS